MKYLMVTIISLVLASSVGAHSGRTDAQGGHNCSQKSKDKGLCTGYHYHSGKVLLLSDTNTNIPPPDSVPVKRDVDSAEAPDSDSNGALKKEIASAG